MRLMWGQTFQVGDLGVVAVLVLLEAVLSADNALVLAIMVRHLPLQLQKKALLYGLGGAFVFRLIAIILAASIIKFWWLQAIGALYLLWLPIKHFMPHGDHDKKIKTAGRSFWGTVAAVEIADIAFAIDSVLAGVAMLKPLTAAEKAAGLLIHPKIWVVYVGAIVGIILLRLAAGMLLSFLSKYPVFDHVAYVIVGWVGVKLAFMSAHNYTVVAEPGFMISQLNGYIFWSVLASIVVIGTWYAMRHPKTLEARAEALAESATMDTTVEKSEHTSN